MKYKGSCHCGQIAFEVEGNLEQVMACNCSICSKLGALRWIVPPQDFRLLTPEENLATYTFNRHNIKHRFCPRCGCVPFGEGLAPSSGNSVVGINARSLDDVDLSSLKVVQFDGRSL